jgi:hypothetical protein
MVERFPERLQVIQALASRAHDAHFAGAHPWMLA